MIYLTSTSQEDIKLDLQAFLEANADKYPVLTNYSGSVKNQILDMLAGFGSFLSFKYLKSVQENNLSTCLLEESGYINAEDFGYNVTRAISPTVQLKYLGTERRLVKSGDQFGSLIHLGIQYQLVYFDDPKTLFPGDLFSVRVANYWAEKDTFLTFDFNDPVTLRRYPGRGYHFDGNAVRLTLNDQKVAVSDQAEDFLGKGTPVVITKCSPSIAEGIGFDLAIYLKNLNQGTAVSKSDEYIVESLITAGFMDLGRTDGTQLTNLSLDEGVEFSAILSYGAAPESLQKIKTLAPLAFLTARRAVTPDDYEIQLKTDPYVSDAKFITFDQPSRSVVLSYVPYHGQSLTDYEKQLVKTSMVSKGVAGVGITLHEATQILESWTIQILYDCASRRSVDSISAFEEMLSQYILDIVNQYAGKLQMSFDTKQILAEIYRITLGGASIVKTAAIRRRLPDGSLVAIDPDVQYESTLTSAFNFDIRFEMTC